MTARRIALSLFFVASLSGMASRDASAQVLGTFRWQLQPFCNVITVEVIQLGATYTLQGFDDFCGAGRHANAFGTALLNPNGTIGIGLTVVAFGAAPAHLEALITLPTLSGSWRSTQGFSGAFVPATGATQGGTISWVSLALGPRATATGFTGTASLAVGNGATTRNDNGFAAGLDVGACAGRNTALGARASTSTAPTVTDPCGGNWDYFNAFVFSDGSIPGFWTPTASHQFTALASNGFQFMTTPTTGCSIAAGGASWDCASDRAAKEGFEPLDGDEVLRKIAAMPVQTWSFITEPGVRHAGPIAQDFHAAFGLGVRDTTIGYTDINGINMRAIQALEARTTDLRAQNEKLEIEVAELRRMLLDLKQAMTLPPRR